MEGMHLVRIVPPLHSAHYDVTIPIGRSRESNTTRHPTRWDSILLDRSSQGRKRPPMDLLATFVP